MLLELYKRLWTVTWRAQIALIVMSLCVAGLAAVPLQYQKEIINGLTNKMQHRELLLLGAQFVGFLLLSSLFKFALGYRSALVGETAIRKIRGRICQSSADYQSQHEDRVVAVGTRVEMVATEAEEIGKFVGGAIASPLMQIGTLVSVIAFVAATQPYLGILMLLVVLPQAAIVMSVQRHVNTRIAERVKILRRATSMIAEDRIKETIDSLLSDFDAIYETRRNIYLFKQSSKFGLNALNGFGTAAILVLGGWLVLEGRADVGGVVAALSGLTRISQPWRELIAFYRELSSVRIKFELLKMAEPKQKTHSFAPEDGIQP